jgi:mono/diheme cytochrome c family protein
MSNRSIAATAGAFATLLVVIGILSQVPAHGQDAAKPPGGSEAAPTFDAAYLKNPTNIQLGQAVWGQQCRHCHGNSAYPGKAPKLRPGSLEPDFIYDRVTNGFRGMPSWSAVFSLEQRMGVVAYIKSDEFAP